MTRYALTWYDVSVSEQRQIIEVYPGALFQLTRPMYGIIGREVHLPVGSHVFVLQVEDGESVINSTIEVLTVHGVTTMTLGRLALHSLKERQGFVKRRTSHAEANH